MAFMYSGEAFIPYFWVALRCKHIWTVFEVIFFKKVFNFSSSIVSEYKLLTMVASFVFFNGLPNWNLASYSFLVGSRIGSRSLVLDHYLLSHKDLEFAAL